MNDVAMTCRSSGQAHCSILDYGLINYVMSPNFVVILSFKKQSIHDVLELKTFSCIFTNQFIYIYIYVIFAAFASLSFQEVQDPSLPPFYCKYNC